MNGSLIRLFFCIACENRAQYTITTLLQTYLIQQLVQIGSYQEEAGRGIEQINDDCLSLCMFSTIHNDDQIHYNTYHITCNVWYAQE